MHLLHASVDAVQITELFTRICSQNSMCHDHIEHKIEVLLSVRRVTGGHLNLGNVQKLMGHGAVMLFKKAVVAVPWTLNPKDVRNKEIAACPQQRVGTEIVRVSMPKKPIVELELQTHHAGSDK